MQKVSIKKPCKTNMQSGLKKTKEWIIEFNFDSTLKKDVLMGWNSSKDTKKQLNLSFLILMMLLVGATATVSPTVLLRLYQKK